MTKRQDWITVSWRLAAMLMLNHLPIEEDNPGVMVLLRTLIDGDHILYKRHQDPYAETEYT